LKQGHSIKLAGASKMVKCSFCGTELPKGAGKMYVKTDAKLLYFCSSKCEKNMLDLKRKPRKTTWTAEYRKEKEQRLATAKSASTKK